MYTLNVPPKFKFVPLPLVLPDFSTICWLILISQKWEPRENFWERGKQPPTQEPS